MLTTLILITIFIAGITWLLAKTIIQTYYREKREHLKLLLKEQEEIDVKRENS